MTRYFFIAQLMILAGVCLRFGIALLPLAGALEIGGWWKGNRAFALAAGYARRYGMIAVGTSVLWLGLVRFGFGYRVYFVDNAWWFSLAMLAGGLLLAMLAGESILARVGHCAVLALMVYLIVTIPYLRAPSRWLSWLFFLGPSVFLLYLPPLIRALAAGSPDAVAASRLLWFILGPALAIFHASYHFGMTILTTFGEGAELFPVIVVYRGMMPLFLAMFIYTAWCQFWVVGRATIPARSAWTGLVGGYAGGLLAVAMLWFGVTIFDTLAL